MSENIEQQDAAEEPEFSQEESMQQIQDMEEEFNQRQIEEYIATKKSEQAEEAEEAGEQEEDCDDCDEEEESVTVEDGDEDAAYWEQLANRSVSVGLT